MTESKSTQEPQSEEQSTRLLKNLPGFVYVCDYDENWTMRFVSAAAQTLLGYAPDDLIGNSKVSFSDLIHPDDREDIWRKAEKNLAERNPCEYVYRIKTASGSEKWVWERSHGVYNGSGELVQIEGYIEDISERKTLEANLATQTEIFTATFEKMNQGCAVYDAEMRVIHYNAQFEKLFEYPPGFLYPGISHRDLIQYRTERGDYGPGDVDEIVKKRIERTHNYNAERSGERTLPNGKTHIHFRTPMPGGGHVTTYTDITERKKTEMAVKESEKKYRALVECASDGLFFHDLNGKLIEVNAAACHSLGYRRDELLTMHVSDLEVSFDPEQLGNFCAEMSAGQTKSMEGVHRRKDGSTFPVEVRVSAFNYGEEIHFLALVRDISDRVRSDEANRLHKAELAHVTRISMVGEMATGLAHELNQPLTSIMNYVDGCLLRLKSEGQVSPTIVEALEKASVQAHRAGDIVRRLRIFVGKVKYKLEKMSINESIREVVDMMQSENQLRQIKLQLDLDKTNPIIYGDEILIQQVILNLLMNGVEAMENVEAENQVLKINTSVKNGGITMVISDTGRGVKLENIERLFVPFQTTKEEGLGLGLAISRSIIEAHDGLIWFEPATPQGAAFKIQLPSKPKPESQVRS